MFGLFNKKKKEPDRKERSEAILKAKNVKVNTNLPHVELEVMTTLREPQEIAQRVVVLAITNTVAFNGLTAEQATDYLHHFGLWEHATPKEKEFLANPTEERKTEETWKCEGIWTLLWALEIIDELGFPDTMCNLDAVPPDRYPVGPGKDPNDFIKAASQSRTVAAILDANDLYYRLHWACVDARINQQEMTIVNPGIVYERHYALNWLIRYQEDDWDDVSCDT